MRTAFPISEPRLRTPRAHDGDAMRAMKAECKPGGAKKGEKERTCVVYWCV